MSATVPAEPDRSRAATIALLRHSGLHRPGIAGRVELGDPVWELAAALGAGATLLPENPEPRLAAAAADLASWARDGHHAITVRDRDYPDALRLVHDRPALLFLAGDAAALAESRAVAVVGSRRPSPDGLARASALAAGLAHAGYTLVSGLAAGIDAAVHRAALDARGRTVAVIPTGLRTAYPPENATLQAELVATQTVLSPFWPEDGPDPERFRRRNAVMSGLSRGTVIVEASVRSGTRVQARLALGHGRPVLLARPLLDQAWARELAARPNVHLADTAAEVLDVLERLHDPRPPA